MTETLRGELRGDDAICDGITVKVSSPAIALCRLLLDRGHAAETRLELYRGTMLALIIRSIGEAAELQVTNTGFARAQRLQPGLPMRQKHEDHARLPGSTETRCTASVNGEADANEEEREDREASKHRTSGPARRRSAA
jgi:hypothetical protein